jgi:lipopolysaccharide biosynthesis protein
MVTGLLTEIKKVLENENKPYEWMEEVVMDIKSMEVQLLSPKPKTGIVREIFNSLHQNLKQSAADAVNQKLSAVLSA